MLRFCFIFLCGWICLNGQGSLSGDLRGVILDASQAVVPGARIRLVSAATDQARVAESDVNGTFFLRNLAIGEYELRVEASGFAPAKIPGLLVSVGQTVFQRVLLRTEGLTQGIEVHEEAEALQTAAPTAGVALGYDRIEESPAAGRNYLNFVFAAPAFNTSNGSNTSRSAATTRNPGNDSGFVFAGLRGRNNSISIDGVDNRDETTGANRVAIGLEMVQEFRVSGTSVTPEFGGAAGGIVNVVTRSGSKVWHGDTTAFAQNERFNARNAESQSDTKPKARRYQPGASLSGPYQKDRGFFATAFEQAWENTEEWSDTPRGFAARPGSAIVPYRGLFGARDTETYTSLKVNQTLNAKNSLMLRYAYSRGGIANDVQAGDNFTDRSARGSSRISDHSFAGNWLWVASARFASDLRGQVARRETLLTPNSRTGLVEIPGVVSFGEGYRLDQQRTEDHYELNENVTAVVGRHVLGVGASVQEIRLDGRFAQRFQGISVFASVADYLAAKPGLTLQSFGNPRAKLNTRPWGIYAQDKWLARPGLTIEYGFRIDQQMLPAPVPSSPVNVAPRLGIAWHPANDSKWVFRAGAGLFYDRYPLGFLAEAVLDASLLVNGQGGYRYRTAAGMETTYSVKTSFGLERKIDKDTTVSLETNLVRGLHLPRTRTFLLEQSAHSRYEGGTVTVNRRMSKEIAYLASYTAGRTRDDASDYDEQPLNPANTKPDWALSRQHQLHRVAVSGLIDAEWGITIAPGFSYGSGRPVNPQLPTDAYGTLAYPLSARPEGFGRNTLYSRSSKSLDLRVFKTIKIWNERAKWVLGVESFNLLNHTNYARVNAYWTGASFRRTFEVLPARQVQVFANLEF